MKIFEYSHFLLESKVYQLIQEAKIEYFEDFKKVISKVEHPIAKDLLDIIGKDVDVTTNFLDLGENPDSVTFYNQNQVKDEGAKIIDNGQSYLSFDRLYKKAGYEFKDLDNLPEGTIGKILNIWTSENSDGIIPSINQKIIEFESLDGEILFIGEKGITNSTIFKGSPQETRIGRLAQRILKKIDKKYSAKEVEDFVNKFKSQVEIFRDKFRLFELVKGDDIAYWYNGKRYEDGYGSLQGSCMRHSNCQSFFSVYTENKDKVSLLIYKSEENPDKISGRAIVWKLDSGETFMDRIYYTKEEEVELFKSYAREKGWMYKKSQNMQPYEDIEIQPGRYFNKPLKVKLDIGFDEFPYMDTMRYLFMDGYLSNKPRLTLDNGREIYKEYDLDSTEGTLGCEYCGGSEEVECPDCDGSGEVECDECGGSGEVECGECDGNGEVECDECGGSGEVEGDDGEMEECSDCDGSGEVDCDECGGSGEVECYRCDGSGEVECYRCDGDGETDCPECC